MCNSIGVEAEGTQTQDKQAHHWGLMPEPIPPEEYGNCQRMCQSQEGQNRHLGEGLDTAPTRTWRRPSRPAESKGSQES